MRNRLTQPRRPEGRRPESDEAYRWNTEHPGPWGQAIKPKLKSANEYWIN